MNPSSGDTFEPLPPLGLQCTEIDWMLVVEVIEKLRSIRFLLAILLVKFATV